MNSGLKPTRFDHRDYDYLKSKKLAGVLPSFAENYSTDQNLWMPSQNEGSDLFTPPCPPMPYGCTNFAQSDLCADEDGKLYNPQMLEDITHANARGGTDLRTSLNAVVKNIPGHPAYFNIRPSGNIDAFDAVRLAMISASSEKRGVSAGTPFYSVFFYTDAQGVLPIPADFGLGNATQHNWAIKGWKTINGVPHLICKFWTGPNFGDHGFGYMRRELFNALMGIPNTAMFTIDKLLPGEKAETVDATIIQLIVSLVRNLFKV